MTDFRCYFLGRDRKVMAVEDMKAPTVTRAVTKAILAMVMREATTFELWRHDLCVYVHDAHGAPPPSTPPSSDPKKTHKR